MFRKKQYPYGKNFRTGSGKKWGKGDVPGREQSKCKGPGIDCAVWARGPRVRGRAGETGPSCPGEEGDFILSVVWGLPLYI